MDKLSRIREIFKDTCCVERHPHIGMSRIKEILDCVCLEVDSPSPYEGMPPEKAKLVVSECPLHGSKKQRPKDYTKEYQCYCRVKYTWDEHDKSCLLHSPSKCWLKDCAINEPHDTIDHSTKPDKGCKCCFADIHCTHCPKHGWNHKE